MKSVKWGKGYCAAIVAALRNSQNIMRGAAQSVMTRCLDPDGQHINVLLLTLFITHLPELIKQGKVYMAIPPLFKSSTPKSTEYFFSTETLEKAKVKGQVTRFKGIGEMDSDSLWDTTMNPETRKVIQLTTENFEESLQLFDTLMGKSSLARRNFIIQNSNAIKEDYFGGDE
jgi:DNA gyrase subunit B